MFMVPSQVMSIIFTVILGDLGAHPTLHCAEELWERASVP